MNSILLLIAVSSVLVGQIGAHDIVNQCDYSLAQTLPVEHTFDRQLSFSIEQTHDAFLDLINGSKRSIKIASFYITLTPEQDEFLNLTSAQPGLRVLEALESAIVERNVKVELLVSNLYAFSNKKDVRRLKKLGAKVTYLNLGQLTRGIQHAKFIISDDESMYLGSANLDWRSLQHVQELGIVYKNCTHLAKDLVKIYDSWKLVADIGAIQEYMPEDLLTSFNRESPLTLLMDDTPTDIYLAASPPKLINGLYNHREDDLDTLVDTLKQAQEYADITVMKFGAYAPIVDAIKEAARRGVHVRLLVAKNDKMKKRERQFFESLKSFQSDGPGKIEVRAYSIPTHDLELQKIPHARVKHEKYIVTDKSVYLGTSNFEAAYFEKSCGVSISLTPSASTNGDNIVDHIREIFERDYYSSYSCDL